MGNKFEIGSRSCLFSKPEVEMSTPKDSVRELLDELPEETSYEDIQYHIYVRQKIDRGLRDLKAGRVLSQKEVERRMSKWLKP